jgi:hypothetical protein
MKKRIFFEKFAKARNLDPLYAHTWYKISGVEFIREKVCMRRGREDKRDGGYGP